MDFSPSSDPMKEPVAWLDPENQEDAEILNNLDEMNAELRKEYPTPGSAVDAYRHGLMPGSNFEAIFNEEEMKYIREEAEKRNSAEADTSL